MKFLIIICLMISVYARAEDAALNTTGIDTVGKLLNLSDEAMAKLHNIYKDQVAATEKMKPIKEKQTILDTQMTVLNEQLKGCTTSFGASGAELCYSGKVSPDDAVKYRSQLKEISLQNSAMGSDIDKINKDQTVALAATADAVAADKNLSAKKVGLAMTLENQLISNGMIINKKYSDLQAGELKVSEKLNVIERVFDKSAMGVYVKDKIGALMNSYLICDVMKNRCGSKEPYPIGADKLNEIFKGSDDSNTRNGKEQWDRTMGTHKSTK